MCTPPSGMPCAAVGARRWVLGVCAHTGASAQGAARRVGGGRAPSEDGSSGRAGARIGVVGRGVQ
eukprot:862674-Prymnesium_polylepis.1